MKPVITSREAMIKRATKAGATPMPDDHPMLSEGPSIQFFHHTQRPSEQKETGSDQNGSANSSGTPKKKSYGVEGNFDYLRRGSVQISAPPLKIT